MRELKFRVWNKDLERMFVAPSDSFSLMVADTGITIAMWCSDGIVDEFPADDVMQYTGLKDKNGKEIFEGDVLRVSFWEDYENKCAYVDEEEKISVKVVFENGAILCLEQEETWYELYDVQNSSDIEIVGNIHEHKELLDLSAS